jgi:hypothetical protein
MLIASSFAFKVREVSRIGGAPLAALSLRLPRGLAVELPGPVFADHARRLSEMAYADVILRSARRLPPGSALFVADWYPMLTYKSVQSNIFQYPTMAQLDTLGTSRIFYVPDTYRDIANSTGIDLRNYGAVELDTRDSATAAPTMGRLHDPVAPDVRNATPRR